MKPSSAVLTSTLAAALLFGCGSSKKQTTTTSSSTPTVGTASSKFDSAFIARVDAVCGRATATNPGPFPYPNFNPVHPNVKLLPKVGAFLAKQQAVADAVPKQFRTLGNPARGQALWAQILTLATRDRAIADRQIAAAKASDVHTFVATVHEISQVSTELGQLAAKAGFIGSSPCRMIF